MFATRSAPLLLLIAGFASTASDLRADPDLPAGRAIPLPLSVVQTLARPMTVRHVQASYPEEARAAGHHGTVQVTVTIAPSGAIADVAVTATSKSPLLDAAALDAARRSTFRPAVGPGGEPTGGMLTLDYAFDGRVFSGYRCDQAARDFAWWTSVWPDRDDPMKRTIRQLVWAREFLETKYGARASQRNLRLFEEGWAKALATCNAAPTAMFADALSQSGVAVPPQSAWRGATGYRQ